MLRLMRFDAVTRRLVQDPREPAFFADPHALYRRLCEAGGPVFWEDYGFWCFSSHAAVSALLRAKNFGRQILHVTTRAALGWPERPAHLADFDALERDSLLELEPPAHTRLRGLVNRAFVSRQIERLQPRIAEHAERLLDALAPGDDLIARFAEPIPIAMIAELVGAPVADGPKLTAWSHRMVAMYQFAPPRADEDAAAGAAAEFAAYLRVLVAERRRSPRDDLISRLIEAESGEGRLSLDELVATVALLLNAGHEATVHALGLAVRALIEAGAGAALARAGEREREAMVEELLRFDPPLHMFTRYALEDAEIEGVRLRQGERVGLLLGAANRDPAVFADPDRLDLARAPNPHVAFGAGIHFCLGAPLARLELRVALAALFARRPGLALVEPPRWRDAYHFRGLEALRVGW